MNTLAALHFGQVDRVYTSAVNKFSIAGRVSLSLAKPQ